jgi:adenylate cyclase
MEDSKQPVEREPQGPPDEQPDTGRQGQTSGKERLMAALKVARDLLPGDSRYGDRLSTSGREPRHVLARQLSQAASKRPGLLSEVGMGALQVWEAVAEGQGRAEGERTLAIVFTDLVGFSNWALEAGDEAALTMLRDVGEAIEPPVLSRGGDVVKRLGDGMMAVFASAQDGLDAVFEARDRLNGVEAPGYRPRIRAGMHLGTPKRLGDDYLGVDVNVAARVADEASGDDLLVSGQALEALDADRLKVKKKLLFRAKGVPDDITVYSVRPR